MSSADVIALLPLVIVALTAVVILLGVAVARHHRFTVGVTLAGLILALIFLGGASTVAPRAITSLLVMDSYAIFYPGMIFAATFAVTLLSYTATLRGAGGRGKSSTSYCFWRRSAPLCWS